MTGAPPLISAIARPFWDGLAAREIRIQRCDDCHGWVFYPRAFCPTCTGRVLTWTKVDGAATLYSWTVARVPVAKPFAHLDQPILAVVELANGVRLPSTLVDITPEAVRIGMALAPVFDSASYDGVTLLRFRPATQ